MTLAPLIAISIVLVGSGHAWCGRPARGALWLGATVVTVGLGLLVSAWLLLAAVALYLGSIVDVAVLARRGGAVRRVSPAFIAISAAGMVFAASLVIETHVYTIPSDSMQPSLAARDHVLVEGFGTLLGSPHAGDVIAFYAPADPDKIFFKRVIAGAGDSVAIRGGVPYVNGHALAQVRRGETSSREYSEQSGQDEIVPVIELAETIGGRTYRIYRRRDAAPDAGDMPVTARLTGGPAACPPQERIIGDPGAQSIVPLRPGPDGGCVVPDGAVFVLGDNRDDSSDSRRWGAVPTKLVIGHVVMSW